ncbi:MAG: biotin/lipoyl-containing protein, partial [Bacteroidota bacterium]
MATVEMVLPAMGESIMEATVLQWLKKEGDPIEQDESILEVATDKVDTEVPASEGGILQKILVQEGDIAQVGKPIAIIGKEGEEDEEVTVPVGEAEASVSQEAQIPVADVGRAGTVPKTQTSRFYSPLVKNIARKEGIPLAELEQIKGTGKEGRVTKKDILNYIESGAKQPDNGHSTTSAVSPSVSQPPLVSVTASEGDEVIPMDRMRKMIA